MVKGCASVAQLAMVVREAASHMSPSNLAVAVGRMTRLPLQVWGGWEEKM